MREPANLVPSMRKPRGRHQIFYSSMHGSRVIRDSDTPKYGHMTIFGHTENTDNSRTVHARIENLVSTPGFLILGTRLAGSRISQSSAFQDMHKWQNTVHFVLRFSCKTKIAICYQ